MDNEVILTEDKAFLDGYAGQKTVRADNTFVVDRDGLPYHVTAEDELYAGLLEDYQANPGEWAAEVLPEPEAVEEPVMIKAVRVVLQTSAPSIPDEEVLEIAAMYPDWQAGVPYKAGQVVNHAGHTYRVVQDVTALANQPPDGAGMLAIYRVIELASSGGIGDPIAWINGMDCTNGKYYSHGGGVYLCKSDMLPCVWAPGSAGMWQWERVS